VFVLRPKNFRGAENREKNQKTVVLVRNRFRTKRGNNLTKGGFLREKNKKHRGKKLGAGKKNSPAAFFGENPQPSGGQAPRDLWQKTKDSKINNGSAFLGFVCRQWGRD